MMHMMPAVVLGLTLTAVSVGAQAQGYQWPPANMTIERSDQGTCPLTIGRVWSNGWVMFDANSTADRWRNAMFYVVVRDSRGVIYSHNSVFVRMRPQATTTSQGPIVPQPPSGSKVSLTLSWCS